jgi:septal ring factor EnvC (AmiA/AmiB activator)
MKKFSLSSFALCSIFALLCLSQDAGQLRLQETNLWSKVESSLLSTQNEIDGLKTLVNSLQTDSAKLTGELTLSREDYSRLQSLQESTASSYSQLSTDYNSLKARYETLMKWVWRLVTILAVWIGVKVIRVLIGFKWPVLDTTIPRWVDILI